MKPDIFLENIYLTGIILKQRSLNGQKNLYQAERIFLFMKQQNKLLK